MLTNREEENNLVTDRAMLKPLTTNWVLSDKGTAIGVMLDILQFLLLFIGKGVSKTTLPAAKIQPVKILLFFSHDYAKNPAIFFLMIMWKALTSAHVLTKERVNQPLWIKDTLFCALTYTHPVCQKGSLYVSRSLLKLAPKSRQTCMHQW